jgi:hypothetical protein
MCRHVKSISVPLLAQNWFPGSAVQFPVAATNTQLFAVRCWTFYNGSFAGVPSAAITGGVGMVSLYSAGNLVRC